MDNKTCTKCLESKPLDSYYSKGTRIDSSCKDCVKSAKRKHLSQKKEPNETPFPSTGILATTNVYFEDNGKIVGESTPICNKIVKTPLDDLETHLVLQNLTTFFETLSLIRADVERSLHSHLEKEHET